MNLPSRDGQQEHSEQFNQAILDALTANIAVIDQEGTIRAVNEAWKRFARENSKHQNVAHMNAGINYLEVCRKARGAFADEAQQALLGIQSILSGEQTHFTLEYPCHSPTEKRWFMMSVTPLTQEQGAVIAHINITERKELERRKDDFLSMASHELKTPLSNIWILTHLLRKHLAEQGFQDPGGNLSQLGTQARQLMKLLTDVLEVSQLEAGYVLYSEETFDFNALVREIVTTLQQVSPDHTIVVIGTADKPVIGDRGRLGQVLTNLLTNAIKYSVGMDKIDVLITSTDKTLTIRVRDYGIGIPVEQQPRIFERFYRAQNSRQGSAPGFGMGLYISHKIVKRHGGTIEVESVEGKGATFTVTLPFQR